MTKLKKNTKGITLVALVITIIILLILAGIVIASLSGSNGLFARARQAREETLIAQEDELRRLTMLEAAANLENTTHTDNSMGVEKTVTIPTGFAVSEVEGENTIEDGLVIIDKNGNEFVWVPVDGILGEKGKTVQNAMNGEIILGRYVFDSNGDIDTTLTPTTLGGELKISNEDLESEIFTETSTGKGNTVAKDIDGFINSVRENGGYYIARFEASKNTTTNKAESKYNQAVWTEISQPDAAIACEDLYEGVNSDLMNSYAWDTAILFIQENGKNHYSRQDGQSINSSKQTTGLSGDVQLNIYDMAGNCREWTTETYSSLNSPCVSRGGHYDSYRYTSNRNIFSTSSSGTNTSFRPLLYL